MSNIVIKGSTLGNSLQEMLMCDEIVPGADPSYQVCKTIFTLHPLGLKMAQSPIKKAMSQQREIAVPKGPEERLRDAFKAEWKALAVDRIIKNTSTLARVYGIASVAMLVDGVPTDRPIDYKNLADLKLSFNVFDPLNTAGSLVLNQDPNAMNYQKSQGLSVQGKTYHRSRCCILMNEEPVYIDYTTSAFGYVGRSVYQRALYPLKSFVQTMVTDDMVSVKSGLLVVAMQQSGSIINNVMQRVSGMKRALLKEGIVGQVLSVGQNDKVESLNLQNLEGPAGQARTNILENIASAGDMPAIFLKSETFAEGFGEGTEDAKHVADYVQDIREWMGPLYTFFDKIVMHRAWNPEFYKIIQREYPDQYANVGYTQAFYDWTNSFDAQWPSLLTEPDSEKIKVDDVKLKSVIAWVEALAPMLDPENKSALIAWANDNFNELKLMFGSPLNLDMEAFAEYVPPAPPQELSEPRPFSAQDSDRINRAMDQLDKAIARLPRPPKRQLELALASRK